jgi:predicted nucleic acid-binding protein
VPVFVDANVLVYSRDASEARKRPLASGWLDFLWRTRTVRLSFQVLHEYYELLLHRLR